MSLTEKDIEAIGSVVSEEAHKVAHEISHKQTITTVHATLKALGMDVDNPLELQQDFAHLRKNREDVHNTKKAAKDAVIRWSITGVFAGAVAWLAANAPIGPH